MEETCHYFTAFLKCNSIINVNKDTAWFFYTLYLNTSVPVGGWLQRLHGGQWEHGWSEVPPQRTVPVVVLRRWRWWDTGARAPADGARVARVSPGGQHGGHMGNVRKWLRVVLSRHAGWLEVHAAQQAPGARHDAPSKNLPGCPFLLALFGSSVLKPNLPRQARLLVQEKWKHFHTRGSEWDRQTKRNTLIPIISVL